MPVLVDFASLSDSFSSRVGHVCVSSVYICVNLYHMLSQDCHIIARKIAKALLGKTELREVIYLFCHMKSYDCHILSSDFHILSSDCLIVAAELWRAAK